MRWTGVGLCDVQRFQWYYELPGMCFLTRLLPEQGWYWWFANTVVALVVILVAMRGLQRSYVKSLDVRRV